MNTNQKTSWQPVSHWYNQLVGDKGSYYHQQVIIPGTLKLLDLKPKDTVLDLGCGQGVLARYLPNGVSYTGVDTATDLIGYAQKKAPSNCRFYQADITKTLPVPERSFSHAVLVLVLQNVAEPEKVLANAAKALSDHGQLVMVLNHPCFRIPRQSGWETDIRNKQQYRRINRYLTPLKIPIKLRPSQPGKSVVTWSFHWSLQSLSDFIGRSGMVITKIEEWVSDKQSQGPAARMENRARQEFPLFMAIKAEKR
jgi:ubiquinone/menaquinone biosynthesis C-methylase UbiE